MTDIQPTPVKPRSSLKMKWNNILLICSGMVLLVFFSTVALAPGAKFREFQELVDADSVFTMNFDPLYEHPEIQIQLKERTYKEALLKLSESDSIQLVVNLSDSIIGLNIKGVMIHQTKFHEFTRDKFLEKLPFMTEIKLLSRPLPVLSQYASIVKEPVVVRHAPKDTLEAELNAWQPDTLIQSPAFVSYVTDQGLQIIFEQDKNEHFRDHWKKFSFYTHLRATKALRAIKNFVTFSRQEYQPAITVKMPVDDLRAVYRALPQGTLIVLKL